MRNPRMIQRSAIGIAVAVVTAALGFMAFAADSSNTDTKPAAVDAERYSDIFGNEVFDIQDLAEGAEIQRRFFNRITPPGFSWLQPMFPPVVPFDATNFDDSFLDDLLGEDKNSVAIYPLSLVLDPKTRETLVYNADGKLIATIPSDKIVRSWPEDADPARVTIQLDLLPSEDVEPYLYTESRVEESIASAAKKSAKFGGPVKRSLGASEFGICNIQKLTNGNMRLTLTNGTATAELFAYTVWHTSTVSVVTNEGIVETNTLWFPVSPPFNGLESAWTCAASNLALTNGVGAWEDANISSNARMRFYGVANRMSSDEDGLTDGAETFLYHTEPDNLDTDGDGLLDGYDIVVGFGDSRYDSWASLGIIYVENSGIRTFRGELSAGSDPLDEDSDDDGFLDGWEVQNELDPMDAEGDNGPEGDPDGDGFDNALEFELGAPANNGAWNGNELAYRLTHAHSVAARSLTNNLIGMRVDIEDSADCGGTAGTQNKTDDLDVPALLACGYYIDVTVEGSVEDVDTNYDKVSFEAYTNTPYFHGHYNRPTQCRMTGDSAMRNVLIMANSTVHLRYDTVSYKWHSGAYCEIIDATNTGPYNVVVSGDDAICVGETTTLGASGAAGPPFTWNGGGYVSVSTNGDVTGLSPGLATVTATGSNGCSGEKKIFVLKPDIGSVAPLADRTLHPDAARKPLLLKQTLPAEWNGLMQLSLSGAVAYWTPTGGTPIASGIFTNAQLPQTIYLEGDGCGVGEASFAIVGPPGCETNTPLNVFGVNATLAGVAELDEESPGGFIADHITNTNVPRTALNLAACGPSGSSGNLVLTWDSSFVQIYTSATGGTALAQFSTPFSGFNGTNLYVEGIAPGSNTLLWSYSGQSDCVDVIQVSVVQVDNINVTSSISGTSANPPPFEGHAPWPFDVTHSPNPDKHMVVFYKDVVDSSFNVQDFDVTLTANVLPSSVTAGQLNELWSKISGPNSGSFNRMDTFEVKYQNPKLGGVYRFDFDLGITGSTKSEANVVLPLAGAEVDSIVSADIGRANTFTITVNARYNYFQRQDPRNGLRWFNNNGAGDYLGRPDSSSAPTVWIYNQVNNNGMLAVSTWKGKPIRIAKISNFMVAYTARKINVNPLFAWVSQLIGTPNDTSATKSWNAGWGLADSGSYDSVVASLVVDIWDDDDDPTEKNMKLWPNAAACDNYVLPNIIYDYEHQFSSPGFLYMTNP